VAIGSRHIFLTLKGNVREVLQKRMIQVPIMEQERLRQGKSKK